ncbi:hypothetical protein HKX48_000142 [Thoreauomyces humboldtii]|nr:hypothetical protein HKX48_000142 [Thoreauomyces humboldtii]
MDDPHGSSRSPITDGQLAVVDDHSMEHDTYLQHHDNGASTYNREGAMEPYRRQSSGEPLRLHSETSPIVYPPGSGPKRSRASKACDTCRKKRTKCSGELPCSGCHAFGFHCHYTETSRRRNPLKKNQTAGGKTLESRLQMMESLLTTGQSSDGTAGEGSISPTDARESTGVGFRALTSNRQTLTRPRETSISEDPQESNSKRQRIEGTGNLLVMDAVGEFVIYHGRSSFPIYISPRYQEGVLTLPFKIPTVTESEYNPDVLRQVLPFTHQQIQQLVATYFQVVHPFLPILDRATFYRTLAEGPDSQPFRALLYAVLIVACHHTGQVTVPHTTIDFLCIQTQQILVEYEISHVWIAQAALVMATSGNLRGTKPFKPIKNKWRLIGLAIRCSQELGLHRNLQEIKRPARPNDPSATEETRRRTWAGCYILDRNVSMVTGRPCMIHDEDWDALIPQGYSDTAEERLDAEYLRAHFELAEIYGMMLQRVNSARGVWKRGKTNKAEGGTEMVQDLQMRLDKWRDELPESLSLETPGTGSDTKRPWTRRELMHAGFHNAILISRRSLLGRYDAEARRSSVALVDLLETIRNAPDYTSHTPEFPCTGIGMDFPGSESPGRKRREGHYLFPGSSMAFFICWDALLAEVMNGDNAALERMDLTMGLMADTLDARGVDSKLTRWALKARKTLDQDMFTVLPDSPTPFVFEDHYEDPDTEGSQQDGRSSTQEVSPAAPPSSWFAGGQSVVEQGRILGPSDWTTSPGLMSTPSIPSGSVSGMSGAAVPYEQVGGGGRVLAGAHAARMLPPAGVHGGGKLPAAPQPLKVFTGHPPPPLSTSMPRQYLPQQHQQHQPRLPPQFVQMPPPEFSHLHMQQQQHLLHQQQQQQQLHGSQLPYLASRPPGGPPLPQQQQQQLAVSPSQQNQLTAPYQPPDNQADFLSAMFGDIEETAVWDLMGFV